MKGSGGKANPKLANALLKRELDARARLGAELACEAGALRLYCLAT